jgi:hypothetical protein
MALHMSWPNSGMVFSI